MGDLKNNGKAVWWVFTATNALTVALLAFTLNLWGDVSANQRELEGQRRWLARIEAKVDRLLMESVSSGS